MLIFRLSKVRTCSQDHPAHYKIRSVEWYKPNTFILALQLLLPTSFETSNVYSPLSFFSVETIFNTETVSVTLILYLGPKVSSFPSLNHFAVMSFVPENLHCKVAGSPSVTSMDTALSVIVAGSAINTGMHISLVT